MLPTFLMLFFIVIVFVIVIVIVIIVNCPNVCQVEFSAICDNSPCKYPNIFFYIMQLKNTIKVFINDKALDICWHWHCMKAVVYRQSKGRELYFHNGRGCSNYGAGGFKHLLQCTNAIVNFYRGEIWRKKRLLGAFCIFTLHNALSNEEEDTSF